jgi:hypothetical protein
VSEAHWYIENRELLAAMDKDSKLRKRERLKEKKE